MPVRDHEFIWQFCDELLEWRVVMLIKSYLVDDAPLLDTTDKLYEATEEYILDQCDWTAVELVESAQRLLFLNSGT